MPPPTIFTVSHFGLCPHGLSPVSVLVLIALTVAQRPMGTPFLTPTTVHSNQSAEEFLQSLRESAEIAARRELDALPYKPKQPEGKIQKKLLGTVPQQRLIDSWVANLDSNTADVARRFLVHLLASKLAAATPRSGASNDYTPVYSGLIRKHFRGLDIGALRASDIIKRRRHNRHERRSAEYAIAPDKWRDYLEAGASEEAWVCGKRIELGTGRETVRRVKSRLQSRSGRRIPDLVRHGMLSVGPTPFDFKRVQGHLRNLREAKERNSHVAHRARYLNDLACLNSILHQGARPLNDDIWIYTPAYTMQMTGRISQIGGGLQSCTRIMKDAAYSTIPDVRNYDLRSSQPRLLIAELENAGLPTSWLRHYDENPSSKSDYARNLDISVESWKRCLCAIIMGGHVPRPSQLRYSSGSLKNILRGEEGSLSLEERYTRLFELVAPLSDELDAWHNYLIGPYLQKHGRRNNVDGKTYVTNAAGATVAVEDLSDGPASYRLKSRLAAFILQGREASLIHRLAASGAQNRFQVLSHEHDGLVVLGEIPPSAVQEATLAANLPPALVDLQEKPFY